MSVSLKSSFIEEGTSPFLIPAALNAVTAGGVVPLVPTFNKPFYITAGSFITSS